MYLIGIDHCHGLQLAVIAMKILTILKVFEKHTDKSYFFIYVLFSRHRQICKVTMMTDFNSTLDVCILNDLTYFNN